MHGCDCQLILGRRTESLSLIRSLSQCPFQAVYPSPTCQNHIKEHISRSLAFEILMCVLIFTLDAGRVFPASGFYISLNEYVTSKHDVEL